MDDEVFKPVVGYEGFYEVSSHGRVRSIYRGRNSGKTLRGSLQKTGYVSVVLSVNSKLKTMTIHRLVATAFIDNPLGLPQVNHKDYNKVNNRVENLEWCSPRANSLHAILSGKYKQKRLAVCKRGHDMSISVKVTPKGNRYCGACNIERYREKREAKYKTKAQEETKE